MDAPRFDRLARSVAATPSRRQVLKGRAGGAPGLELSFWHGRERCAPAAKVGDAPVPREEWVTV